MTSTPELGDLAAFEQGVYQSPDTLSKFIYSWEGFDWFWQLIVFVTYSERTELRARLEAALSGLAISASPQSNAELAEQLLSKVQIIDELTHEALLYHQVQRLALILIPTRQVRTI